MPHSAYGNPINNAINICTMNIIPIDNKSQIKANDKNFFIILCFNPTPIKGLEVNNYLSLRLAMLSI